jgi:hypothetical protein
MAAIKGTSLIKPEMKNTEQTIDKNIEKAFKTLEQEINKKAELCDPGKHRLLGEITEHILLAMDAFQKIKS